MWNEDEDGNVNLENGHYSSGEQSDDHDSDDENTSDEEEDDEDEDVTVESGRHSGVFDTNLPTTHKYLGRLENISGYTLYDDGEIIELLSICTNTLAFPGFTLPLVLRGHMENDIKNGYTFVLTCLNKDGNNLFEYGVIMEVFEHSNKRGTVTLKAKGRQRCRLLFASQRFYSWPGRMKVQVLAEPLMKSPLCNTQLMALKQRRPYKGNFADYNKFLRYRKMHVMQFVFPLWVYDQNEVDFYTKHIVDGLLQYYMKENIPQDPTALSYWFVQNFQLTHDERLTILACNTTLERLRCELYFLGLERVICCGHCELDIANQNTVFAMSKDGVQSNYVNPGGVVYETVTVSEARNFQLDGLPSKQFSWFPGYAWTIMKCHSCKRHLGWKFTSRHLQPTIFYGLAHSSLKIKILTD